MLPSVTTPGFYEIFFDREWTPIDANREGARNGGSIPREFLPGEELRVTKLQNYMVGFQ